MAEISAIYFFNFFEKKFGELKNSPTFDMKTIYAEHPVQFPYSKFH